ncbi:hypothetical protein [Edaphobacter bradus]|uniref:hypothetical protein n=1 Tax=Edaphobacter bradus TaxID=2259016 RepID=UPI0021E02A1D|nr:hypothetical protein [Edaphobacter bradus]
MRQPATGNSRRELLLYGAATVSLLLSCILWSPRKQQWVDEIFTRTEASDPSFTHLFHALRHMGTAEMPLFYLTAWPWAHIFGHSDLSLRLYSSVAMCAAMLVLATTLRQCWPSRPVAIGVLTVWCGSAFISMQNVEGRCYGLYILVAALAVAAYLRAALPASPSRLALFLLTASQAALVLTHILAIIYGAVMLVALVLFDAFRRRLRPLVYLCHASGWLMLLLWIPAIHAAIEVGRPRSWISLPTLIDVVIFYTFGMFEVPAEHILSASPTIFGAAEIIVFVCILAVQIAALVTRLRLENDAQRALLILGSLFLVTPLAFVAISYAGSPIFIYRYMLPSLIGLAILLTSLSFRFLKGRYILLVCAALLTLPVISAYIAPEKRLDVPHVEEAAGNNLPIVAADQHDFFVLLRYSSIRQRYVYLLDGETALHGQRSAVGDFHLTRAYRSQGYYASNILDQTNFLCSHSDFLVLDSPDSTWFDQTVSSSTKFSWKVIAEISTKRRLIAVRRITPLPFCS